MSRRCLVLTSQYRSDSQLVREPRIRMEVPGMPLYDKEEQELVGITLQKPKRKRRMQNNFRLN